MNKQLSEEDQLRAALIIKQAGLSFAGIIVEWEDKTGVVKYGVVPSNLEKSVTDMVFIDKIKKEKKTIVYTREGDKILKTIIKIDKLKIIGFNN